MSRDQLIERLKVAEDTLVLVGWSSTQLGVIETERSKAAEQMWQMWYNMVGGRNFCDPRLHADLEARIPQLAETRNQIHAATLAKIEQLFNQEK